MGGPCEAVGGAFLSKLVFALLDLGSDTALLCTDRVCPQFVAVGVVTEPEDEVEVLWGLFDEEKPFLEVF